MALTVACDIHPLNNLRVLTYLETVLRQNEAIRNAWYAAWVSTGFTTLEAMLSEKSGSLYAAGPEPGLADICLVPQVFNARRHKVELQPYPRLIDVTDRAARLKAFADAAPPRRISGQRGALDRLVVARRSDLRRLQPIDSQQLRLQYVGNIVGSPFLQA